MAIVLATATATLIAAAMTRRLEIEAAIERAADAHMFELEDIDQLLEIDDYTLPWKRPTPHTGIRMFAQAELEQLRKIEKRFGSYAPDKMLKTLAHRWEVLPKSDKIAWIDKAISEEEAFWCMA